MASGKLSAVSPETEGYYSAVFSPSGLTYLLSYEGPELPHAEYRSIQDPGIAYVVSHCSHIDVIAGFIDRLPDAGTTIMNQTLKQYDFPQVLRTSINTTDPQFTMNVKVFYPMQYYVEQNMIKAGKLRAENRTLFPVILN